MQKKKKKDRREGQRGKKISERSNYESMMEVENFASKGEERCSGLKLERYRVVALDLQKH